ncbi:MAG: hypothetical protein WCK93_10300 [Nitrosomonadales bacterium]
MIDSIGCSPVAATTKRPSASGLAAQLNRYQRQLDDSVNCSSAKTPEGQETARSLSDKINEVKTKIEKVTSTKPLVFDVNAPANSDKSAAKTQSTTTSGSRLEVFA